MARRALADLFGPVEVVDAGLGVLRPASGASCWVYATGTTTSVTVYADASSSTTLTLPVTTNSQGEPPGYVATDQDIDLVSVYKGNTTTSTATSLTAADVVGGGGGGATSLTSTATPTAAGQIPQSVGTVSRAVTWTGTAAVLNTDGTITNLSALGGINVQKYGAKGDGTTDDTAAFVAAQAAAVAARRPLYIPGTSGGYRLTSGFTIQPGERWIGDKWAGGVLTAGATQLHFVFSSPGNCFSSANPLAFCDACVFQDLQVVGDETNTQTGFYMQSCRHWKFERIWINNMTQYCVYLYGQRNALGQIDSSNPGDCTHNRFLSCTFVSDYSSLDAVRLGGTQTNTIATITADSGSTITVSDTSQIFGSAGTIVTADNGEWINFNGKSTTSGSGNLQNCTRGIAGTTQITHPSGTLFAVRSANGTSNMQYFADCVISGAISSVALASSMTNAQTTVPLVSAPPSTGKSAWPSSGTVLINSELISYAAISSSTLTGCTRGVNGTTAVTHPSGTLVSDTDNASRYGIWMECGASNVFSGCAVSGCGKSGMRFSWYSNTLSGCVSETNGNANGTGAGVHFDGGALAHDNWVWGQHDGGSNLGGLFIDDNGGNVWVAYGRGLKLSDNNWGGSSTLQPNSLYTLTDGLPHWKDKSGVSHQVSYLAREQQQRTARAVTAETYPAVLATSSMTPTTSSTPNGTIYLGLVGLWAGDTITNIIVCVSAGGSGTAPTTIKLGLVSKTGTVLATTANLGSDSRWTSGGMKSCALSSSYAVTADDGYYLAFLQSGTWGTTAMTLLGIANAANSQGAIGSGARPYTIDTAQTDITGSLTLATPNGSQNPWLACS